MRAPASGPIDVVCRTAFPAGIGDTYRPDRAVFPPGFEPWELLGVFLGYATTRTEVLPELISNHCIRRGSN